MMGWAWVWTGPGLPVILALLISFGLLVRATIKQIRKADKR